jgi:hypothetical protein
MTIARLAMTALLAVTLGLAACGIKGGRCEEGGEWLLECFSFGQNRVMPGLDPGIQFLIC